MVLGAIFGSIKNAKFFSEHCHEAPKLKALPDIVLCVRCRKFERTWDVANGIATDAAVRADLRSEFELTALDGRGSGG